MLQVSTQPTAECRRSIVKARGNWQACCEAEVGTHSRIETQVEQFLLAFFAVESIASLFFLLLCYRGKAVAVLLLI